jgi:predicted MFS family arabinose efflux permease
MFWFLAVQAINAGVQCLLNFAIYRDKPEVPPGPGTAQDDSPHPSMKDALIAMSKNWGFMCNNIIFTLLYSCQNALATVLGEIATVYGFEPEEASLFGVTIIVGAISGSILYGYLLEKLKNYKSVLVFICIASTISTTALIYIIPSGVVEYVAAVFFCIGFNIISVAVVCFDLGVEQLYPLGESFSPTILNLSDAIGTLILISLCTTLL